MEAIRTVADELTRLQVSQARVHALDRAHDWFADAIRRAFTDYLTLGDRFRAERSALHERKLHLARELLANGCLFDRKCNDNEPCLMVRVEGLCPGSLANRLARHGRGSALPRDLEQEGAAAALAALDREVICQARELPEKHREAMWAEYQASIAAGTHVGFTWRVIVVRPDDWQDPADPHSLDRENLERFTDSDFRTIALYWLGGLADVGAIRPIVPKPKGTGDLYRDVVPYAAWRARFPIDDHHWDHIQPPLSVHKLPPIVAEQLLDSVEMWVKREADARAGEGRVSRGHQTAGAVEKRDSKRPTSEGANWREVQRRLLGMYGRGDEYTTIAKLAECLGCSKSTVQKAIKDSAKLKGWQARHLHPDGGLCATSINGVVIDNAVQVRETDPAAEAEDADWEIEFARLIDQASEAERATLHAMSDHRKRELVTELRNETDRYDRVLGRKP